MNDAAAQGRSFDPIELPLQGLQLIEASAGTGKTFSLAGLYLRLIVEQQAGVRDILVMTFTRAATRELRGRIQKRLTEAARLARRPDQADPDNPEHRLALAVLDRSDESEAALVRRLNEAAARIDEATIVTIHKFAQRAITENAFDSALAFDRGEPVDDRTIHREATADYWRRRVFGTHGEGEDLLSLWPAPDVLYQQLKPLFDKPHAALFEAEIETGKLLRDLSSAWPNEAEPLTKILQTATQTAALYKNGALNTALYNAGGAAGLVATLHGYVNYIRKTNRLPVLPEWVGHLGDPTDQFKQANKHQQLAAELAELESSALLARLQAAGYIQAVREAADTIRGLARQRKGERRQYSFDDLIMALDAALAAPNTGPALADALYKRWPWALVDEFQDTDPLQYASLRRIYLDTPRPHGALLLIGDPKQAIYGFRGGDIHAYLAAARKAGDQRHTLTTNFRSTQAILDAIEALYTLPADKPFLVDEIDFPRVSAPPASKQRRLVKADQSKHPALTFWHLQGSEKFHKNGRTGNPEKPHDTSHLTARTIAAISELLSGQAACWQYVDGATASVQPDDIAILVNTNKQAGAMQRALAASGIMAVCEHQDSVFASEEAADLQLVLRAMATPDDAGSVRTAQTTDLLGKRLADLIQLADDDHALQRVIETFHELHELWQRHGVLTALERLFKTAAPRLLTLIDGERRMSNYLQLGELLAGAEAETFGMASLMQWLDQQIAEAGYSSDPDDDSAKLRLESDHKLIRICTVFKAKGLEFPIVFLPFAMWLDAFGRADKPPLHFHTADGRARIDLLNTSKKHTEQAVTEHQSEGLRLLYVALTRAEHALFVGWRDVDDYGQPDGALQRLLYRDDATTNDRLQQLAQNHPGIIRTEIIDTTGEPASVPRQPATGSDELSEARRDLPGKRPPWSFFSFSQLARTAAPSHESEVAEPGAEDEWVEHNVQAAPADADHELPLLDSRLSGVRFGSAVHDLLESIIGNAWPAPGESATTSQLAEVAHTLRRYGLIGNRDHDPRMHQTAALVSRILHAPLPDIGPLAHIDHNNLIAEMAFMLRLDGSRLTALIDTLQQAGYLPGGLGEAPEQILNGLMQGFIDLIVQHDDRFIIIDYKTNNLGDTAAAYAPAHLQTAVHSARYDLQYLIYSVALHRHLKRCLAADYNPQHHLGGVQYLFVRGLDDTGDSGVFVDHPDVDLIRRLDELFAMDGRMKVSRQV